MERMEFAMLLIEYIIADRPLMYFDETTFNGDMHMKKAWFVKGQRFAMPIIKQAQKKGVKQGFTVYGTVGESIKDNGYFEIHKSSNKVDFMGYMARLRTQMTTKPGEEKPVLVLDNLGAHCGEPKRKLMRTFCKPEYTPTYSCELNGPIETCWAILKKRVLTRWTKLLIRKAGNKSKLKAIVRDELYRKIDKQIFANVCRSHYSYLQDQLDKVANGEYIMGSHRNWID